MLCIACSKHLGDGSQPQQEDDDITATPRTKKTIKALTTQIKGMVLKASGAYKKCKRPSCSGSSYHHQNRKYSDADSVSERFHCYRRTGGSSSSTPRMQVKEMEARLKGLSIGEITPPSVRGRTESVVFIEEDKPKEWVAQVEPGVLITFVSLPQGGNYLKGIKFSYEMFNKWQAHRWWTENYDKVMELYSVQICNQQTVSLSTPPRSEDEVESSEHVPVTPPLGNERLPGGNFHRPTGTNYSSPDSVDRHPIQCHCYCDASGIVSTTPQLSSISGAKTETSSVDASIRSSSSREMSGSSASDFVTEWVEDEPGVSITIRALPDGTRELRRVRFSREMYGETHAKIWWEENRARIQEQYL